MKAFLMGEMMMCVFLSWLAHVVLEGGEQWSSLKAEGEEREERYPLFDRSKHRATTPMSTPLWSTLRSACTMLSEF